MSETHDAIVIKNARLHNLKNIDLSLPRNTFTVITGVSGSGKSTLAFDTLYAEGQRRYVESLSSYARQFLGKINKPEVDYIHGIPPAIAIEQKVSTRNPRSTVGTSTEIYDYMKLLYARAGITFSPISGNQVKQHSVTDVIDSINAMEEGTKLYLLIPLHLSNGKTVEEALKALNQEGFTRVEYKGEIQKIEDLLNTKTKIKCEHLFLLIDRMKVKYDDESQARYADSIQQAFAEGKGECFLVPPDTSERLHFSNRFEADGMVFEEPSQHMFSFNNPIGACPTCEGYGKIIGVDEELVIPNKKLSVYEDAIACWRGEKMQEWKNKLIYTADKFNFPIHKPYDQLTDEQRDLLWTGNKHFKGINSFFAHLEKKKYKIQHRVMLARYRGKTTCPDCRGTRLKKEASYVKVADKSMQDLVLMPIEQLQAFFETIALTPHQHKVADRILKEIRNRLKFLLDVGLGYLTLNRLSNTLSGGESQRINLATSLGSSLVGSLYILDEPSIGLHPRDTDRLIKVLKELRDLGNTVVVVEHDEDIIRAADHIIDIGPLAGRHGGEIVYQGGHDNLLAQNQSLTAEYLTEKRTIALPSHRRKWNQYIELRGARENNLKNIDVKFPLHTLTVVTGVSGSGKSSLVRGILAPVLSRRINSVGDKPGKFDEITGDLNLIKHIEFVDQNPIGRSSRSNPVTYLKAYDEIRKLFAQQQLSKQNNFKASHFSFNTDGGRCEECQGEGFIKVEMQFMADVVLECEHCHGRRFKEDVLEVKYREKSIFDVLEMTVNEALEFFEGGKSKLDAKVVEKMKPLADVGLGYIKLGQASSTLSGGESQRVKLASFLGKEASHDATFFIFDEPTTGLHFHDINKLLDAFQALIEKGHSLLVIEHNLEIIKSADWLIDLGKEGGDKGGYIVAEGTPEELSQREESYTAYHLKHKLAHSK